MTAAPIGIARALPSAFFGVNGTNLIRETSARDPGLATALGSLQPDVLRVFGGTTANYWDWRTGWFVNHPKVPKDFSSLEPQPAKLADWKSLTDAASAEPIFDLNLVTSTLSEQLAMLRAAANLGFSITRVELGNELYDDAPAVLDRFPTPQSYAAEANRWIRAIRKEFPQARIGVVAAPARRQNTTRATGWNDAIRSISGADGWTLHFYFGTGLGRRDRLASGDVPIALRFAADALERFRRDDLNAMPADQLAWVTEYNVFNRDSPVPGTWLHGLMIARVTLGLVTDPKVDNAVLHTMVGNTDFATLFGPSGAWSSPGAAASPAPAPAFARTAVGWVMESMFRAATGATSAQALEFTAGESGPVSALVGVRFGGTRTRVVVANLSDAAYSLTLSSAAPGASVVRRVWGDPLSLVGPPGSIAADQSAASSEVVLPPFSVVEIG